MAGVHVIVTLLIAARAVALVFDVAIERSARTALARIVEDAPDADARAGRAGVSEVHGALQAIILGGGGAVGVPEDVGTLNGALDVVVVGFDGAVQNEVELLARDPVHFAHGTLSGALA